MKKLCALLMMVAAAGAFAAESEHAEAQAPAQKADKASGVVNHILHHVADSDEFELEIPWPGVKSPTINIAHYFGEHAGEKLWIEKVPGACALPTPPGVWNAIPSLGKAVVNGCWDLRPTKAMLMIWIATALLLVVMFLGSKRDQNGVPRGFFTNLVESLLLFIRDEIAIPNIGKEEGPKYVPFLATAFFFIMFIDYLGLIPGFFSGTGVLGVTLALAVITFVITQIAGLRSAGPVGYVTHLFGDVPLALKPIMFIVETIGLFTKPFALMIRLFANMLAGHVVLFCLLALIFILHTAMAAFSVPVAGAIYVLELFVAILQAYIFTLMTAVFIGQSVALGHHHHDAAHGHEEHGQGH